MIETVFKGATRPPMKFGVPLVPLVVLLLPGFISGMWLSTMVNWRFAPVIFGSLAVAYIWMRIVTSRRPKQSRHSCETKFVTPPLTATTDCPKPSNDAGFQGLRSKCVTSQLML